MSGLTIPANLVDQEAQKMDVQQLKQPNDQDVLRVPRWLMLLGSNLADAETTRQALGRSGTREGNTAIGGIANNPYALYGLKIGSGVGESLLMDLLAKLKHKKLANVTTGGITGLNVGLSISNSRKGKQE